MSLSFLLAVLLSQQNAAAPVDRLEPLKTADGPSCTADRRWCVSLEAADSQVVPVVRPAGTAPTPPVSDESSDESYAVWPSLVLLADSGFLAGVEARTGTSYSGGGGGATELRLFRVSRDGQTTGAPVLTVPIGASLMIRACFSERDMKNRRGACHDEYSFLGHIALAGGTADGLPELAYVSEAYAFPRGVSRMEDSTTRPRLKKSDLVQERDPECSFARRFRFNAASGAYQPDTPLPDCTDYTVP